ncbi:efflux transporter outer membrane subunit [Paraburkholderia caballeronis]|uniref:Efflux transporter, outer membrane factor (OMF) lipoprotein, NodT family n=1 Tax=Paraburkholderia caballeronis TaxID=416943 RepID=A0A1H7L6H2_9BURK|nr:efflux transporter outer membrane subunit [Paraburkholderia caballeronis]PXW28315.1 NodT family efflux transporter outer membrane factor (OMF) lipoprotein [Paraburkholderia caballeronis]PXX03681.1 NodT family efflux transporter outer membrane factor (OMF) lipoprotein [Paraburkholderia caballeronis]RAK04425.1 NodT family efflux transporter outer membrane factor (OMF) lipoprotein [Paraburkholderia caballeronis]SED80709.1 efflux transporter, outer membrane factor (OMF) lipoprotein, NodT family 
MNRLSCAARLRLLVGFSVNVWLAACSLAPDYEVSAVPIAEQYRATSPWIAAVPADRISRDDWWTMYDDPQLDELEVRLLRNNADLQAAFAHYDAARAYVGEATAGLYPQVTAVVAPQRNRQSDTRPLRAGGPDDYTSVTIGAQINYDVDLWNRVRDSVTASKADAQSAQADFASVQLSLQAQLAEDYVRLRGFDQQTALLEQTVDAYAKAVRLTETLHSGGIVTGLDVSRAQTQLASAKSQLEQNVAQRTSMEHAIAVLVGASASQFTLPRKTSSIGIPVVPVGVPSELLQRRPDIAAAERRVAAANARIGVARAAFFPALTLSAQGGVQSSAYSAVMSAPSLFWTVGPQLAQYIFDGGLRRAQLDEAKAAENEAAARYRGVVLSAFQQVEDGLSQISDLGTALADQHAAAAAAQRSLDLALSQYGHGAVGYLDVVQAQTAALESRRSEFDLQTRQLDANVQLVRALGGGWLATSPTSRTM